MKDVVNTRRPCNVRRVATSASAYVKSPLYVENRKDKDKEEEEEEEEGVRLSSFWTTKSCALCAYFLPRYYKRDLYERRWSTIGARSLMKNEEQQALLFSFQQPAPVRLLLATF